MKRIVGDSVARVYNGANAVLFSLISAAMITVSATAIRRIFSIPAQTEPYPTNIWFILICLVFSAFAVVVAVTGFDAVAEIATMVAPWLMLLFTVGGMVLLPQLVESITGNTVLHGFGEFVDVAGSTVFTGINAEGEEGIGIFEVIGFAWAANTFAHFGLVDMAILRYAKKSKYAYATATGMMFGHYVAWISAGLMGAAAAWITATSIAVLEPGDVAWHALGATGFIIVVIAGWTTANPNIYRAGLAAQSVFPNVSRVKVTFVVGVVVAVASVFPFFYRSVQPLLTYAGLILVPLGGIVFAEHYLFTKLGLTKYWARYKGVKHNLPAFIAWAAALVVGFGLNLIPAIPYYYMFIPAWVTAILVYTVLARSNGAAQDYPEQKAADDAFDARVKKYQAEVAETEDTSHFKDRSWLGWALLVISVVALAAIFVFAWRVLFFSPDLYHYFLHREQFYTVTLVCTLVYFAAAYARQQRTKWLRKRRDAGGGKKAAPVDHSL
jgi:purine-cytosine permease-like protein